MQNFQYPMFIDMAKVHGRLDKRRDPLKVLNTVIPWEGFRKRLRNCWRKVRHSDAGRPPYDYVMMFKVLVLQRLHNLSDEAMEFQIADRNSWQRFLGLGPMDVSPDRNTIWNYREALTKRDKAKELFKEFERILEEKGYAAKGGQILDATIVEVPIVRNSDKDNDEQGKNKDDENPFVIVQKDSDARWTKKGGRSFFGYKNHVRVDVKHKLVRQCTVTPANINESEVFNKVIGKHARGTKIYGDSAYHNNAIEEYLKKNGYVNCIQEQGRSNRPLSKKQRLRNKRLSRIRKRVEHVFGLQHYAMSGSFMRCKGLARAYATVVLTNLASNIKRFLFLERCQFA